MQEQLLHYVWQHRLFPLAPLRTTRGLPVEIIDVGMHNTDAGPDFFNAKIDIDGTTWVGNVEIHCRASQWNEHGHNSDEAYNNVVLHVVAESDTEVRNQRGDIVAQLVLPVPDSVRTNYETLERAAIYPPCKSAIPNLSPLLIHSWLSALQTERLEEKAEHVCNILAQYGNDWEAAYFIALARNFGFGLNGDAFEAWAQNVPFAAAAKHRDSIFQIEALFFGQAGLLDERTLPVDGRAESLADGYFGRLQTEYQFLAHKFDLTPMDAARWRFLRLRPQNFPHIRLAQLATLYCNERADFSHLLEATNAEQVYRLLDTHATPYWETHYTFGHASAQSAKQLTRSSLDLLIINTVVPVLFAYGRSLTNEAYCERALALLEHLKAENNAITRSWTGCGIDIHTAADSQAIIQLKRAYCDRHECLRCRFGYEFLKENPWPVVREE